MSWSINIGSIAGTAVRIHVTFILLLAFFFFVGLAAGSVLDAVKTVVFVLLLFACVLAHEFGHIFTARAFGVETPDVTLLPIGGVARLARIPEKPSQELLIAIAGPLVNVAIAVVLMAVTATHLSSAHFAAMESPNVSMVDRLAEVNLFLAIFNMIPAFPMDGGRVLRALLTFAFGRLRATEIAAGVGLFMAVLIAASAIILPVVNNTPINPMPIVLAVFVLLAGQFELWGVRRLEARRRAAQMAQAIPEAEWVPVPVEPRSHPDVPFSGVAWDQRSRVWVRWINGQPVGYWG